MKTKLLTTVGACAMAMTMAFPLVAGAEVNEYVGRDNLGGWGKDPALQGVTKEIYEEMNDNPNYPNIHRAADGSVTFENMPSRGQYIVTENYEGAMFERASDGTRVYKEVVRYKVSPQHTVTAPDGSVIVLPPAQVNAMRRGDAIVVYDSVSVYDRSGNLVEPDLMMMSEEVTLRDGSVVREGYLVRKDSMKSRSMMSNGKMMRGKSATYRATPTDSIHMSRDGSVLYEETTDTMYRYNNDMGRYSNQGPVKYTNEYEIYRGPETR